MGRYKPSTTIMLTSPDRDRNQDYKFDILKPSVLILGPRLSRFPSRKITQQEEEPITWLVNRVSNLSSDQAFWVTYSQNPIVSTKPRNVSIMSI